MTIVIDASVSLAWFFEDERTPAIDAVLDQVAADGAVVPSLWRLEVANGLQMARRRKRIDVAFRDFALQQLTALPITVDLKTDICAWSATLHFADRFRLTLYDAAYLELAQRSNFALASLDQQLRDAGNELRITVLGAAT